MALGVGVMLNMLRGNGDTVAALKASVGKKIKSIGIVEDKLVIKLYGNETLTLWDDGQSCCESRYMQTDDDGVPYKGAVLQDFEIRDAPSPEPKSEYGNAYEVQFLDVKTSVGVFTCTTHNEHNGYYGGFSIAAKVTKP